MLKIRLQRTGRINQPSYRIIVTEHTRPAKTGDFVEQLGTYNPTTKARTLKEDRVKYWLSVGAKASGTMHNMLFSMGIISGKKINVLPRKSPPKKEPAAGQSSGEATEVPAAETSKEEASAPAVEDSGAAKEEVPVEEKEEEVTAEAVEVANS